MPTTSGTSDQQIQDDVTAVLQESLQAAAEHLGQPGGDFAPFGVVRDTAGRTERAQLEGGDQPVTLTPDAIHAAIVDVLTARSADLVAATVVAHVRARTADGSPGPTMVRIELEHRDEAQTPTTMLVHYTQRDGVVVFDQNPPAQPGERRIWA